MVRLFLGFLVIVAALLVGVNVATWPNVRKLATQRPTTTAFIERYRRDARAEGTSAKVEWEWVGAASISADLKRAVLVSEDIGFFSHHGFEPEEMRRAVTDALKSGVPPRGASTITQQLAKNLWLSPSRNPLRKIKEAILTWQLEHSLSKNRILELYLNVAEFGRGIYGVEAASRHYFGTGAAALTAHQSALLAATLSRPRTWNPVSGSASYARQVARVEDRMARATFLRRHFEGPSIARDTIASLAADSALLEFLRGDTLLRFDSLAVDSR